MLKYSEVISLVCERKQFSSPDEIVENTELYQSLEQLASMLEPYESTNAWWGNLKRWSVYAKAKIDNKRIARRPAREFALVPFLLDYLRSKTTNEEYYEIHVRDLGRWFSARVYKGNNATRKIYFDMVDSAMKILPKIDEQLLKNHVPYRFRSGVIKGKYLFEPIISKEEAERIIREYEERNKQEIYPISLSDYLRVAGYCIKANFPEESHLSDIELYKKHADMRHGGMLDLPMDDKEAFSRWHESYAYGGSHPFEIIAGAFTIGICLYPPEKRKKRFVLRMGETHWSEFYFNSAKALLENNVPFDAPRLKDALEYLTGEMYLGVNKWENDFNIPCFGNEEFVKHVEWDQLELPKIRGDRRFSKYSERTSDKPS